MTPRRGDATGGCVVLGVGVDNDAPGRPATSPGWTARDVAARLLLRRAPTCWSAPPAARFVSLLDGPDWAAADAAACTPAPVLAGAGRRRRRHRRRPGRRPIILGDHPSIAPESAGDLFDATEIDEILTLRVMTMTEQEKAEARGTDPRAAAILARCDAHDATTRWPGCTGPAATRTDPDACPTLGDAAAIREDECPGGTRARTPGRADQDTVLVGGVPVSQGQPGAAAALPAAPTRRTCSSPGTTAVVARVYFDVDGGTHVAVVLEDDPAADLYDTTGRFSTSRPEELEPLPARGRGARPMTGRVLVAGIGNLFLTDDGFGSEVARRLAARAAARGRQGRRLRHPRHAPGVRPARRVRRAGRRRRPARRRAARATCRCSRSARTTSATASSTRTAWHRSRCSPASASSAARCRPRTSSAASPADVGEGIGLTPAVAAAVDPAVDARPRACSPSSSAARPGGARPRHRHRTRRGPP